MASLKPCRHASSPRQRSRADFAFDGGLQQDSIVYRAINTVVLVGFTIGWVALAITAAGR